MTLRPIPFGDLLLRMRSEIETGDAIFDLPVRKWFVPDPDYDFSATHFGRKASTPVGPAAGPHTQLAQNIVLAWLAGARIIELKTVQVNDRLEIPRPCIHAPNVGLNVEWSQELRIGESIREYAKAAFLIAILKHTRCFGRLESYLGLDTIFDTSVGYDLAGIQSESVAEFLHDLRNPQHLYDELRRELTGELHEYRDLELPEVISDCVTLSTFHGCPADEIESITRYLIAECGFNAIVKLNPTLLGFENVRELLVDRLGYQDYRLRPEAFDADLQYEDALAILRNLREVAEANGSDIGAKFTNTLVVENNRDVFPTQADPYMYVSGAPLHVISMTLMQKLRSDLGFEIPVSFSAGIDAQNFSNAVACGMVPITTCTDLLRQGGYGRLPAYLKALRRAMDGVGVQTREAFVLAAGGHGAMAAATALGTSSDELSETAVGRPNELPAAIRDAARGLGLDPARAVLDATRIAGRLNGGAIVNALAEDPKYAADRNSKTPRRVHSELDLYDCLNCDICIAVCPNDAFFSYDVEAAGDVNETHQLALVDDACNECSNCEVFCPEHGAPFTVKERVFVSREGFDESEAEGFWSDGEVLVGRIDGNLVETPLLEPVNQANPFADRIERARRGIFLSSSANPVNPHPGVARA